MDSRIYQDPDKADADEVLNLSDDVAKQAQTVSQLSALVESQAQEVQSLKSQLSSLSQALTSLRESVCLTPGDGISLASYVFDRGGSHVTRVGTTCYIRFFLEVTQGFAANSILTKLPADMCPPVSAFIMAEVTVSGVMTPVHGDVTSDGYVLVPKTVKAGDDMLVWGAWGVVR